MTPLFTIGHSNHSAESFLALLERHGVETVVDVRSQPWSRRYPHFRKKQLQARLTEAGIGYELMGAHLGGRPEGDEYRDAAGRIDYDKRRAAPDFLDALEALCDLAATTCVAIMCAEEDPAHCHRTHLIGVALRDRDIELRHVRRDGSVEVSLAGVRQLPLL